MVRVMVYFIVARLLPSRVLFVAEVGNLDMDGLRFLKLGWNSAQSVDNLITGQRHIFTFNAVDGVRK
jgi:hypothetical protein